MKKFLLFALLGLFSVTTFAQYDLEVTMLKPVSGQYIVAGDSWDVEVTVTNNGTTAVAITDTLAVYPSIAGFYVINPWAEFVAIPIGGSTTITFVHPPLTGPDGLVDFCVEVYVYHQTEVDSSDNKGCKQILWDSDPTVGIEEFSSIELDNNSFYSNSTYNVDVNNVYNQSNIKLTVVNLTGQTVLTQELSESNGKIEDVILLNEMSAGIYLFNITSNEGMNLTQKVMID